MFMFINIGDPETFGNATWELADDLVKAIEQAFPEEMAQKVLMRNLEDLMQGEDPTEGLKAFIEKKQAIWKHR